MWLTTTFMVARPSWARALPSRRISVRCHSIHGQRNQLWLDRVGECGSSRQAQSGKVGMQRILVGLALLLVVPGCDSGSQGGRALPGARRGSTTTLAGATATTAGVPPACTAAGTTALVKGFFAALSRGK
jgi:hypothetical protein